MASVDTQKPLRKDKGMKNRFIMALTASVLIVMLFAGCNMFKASPSGSEFSDNGEYPVTVHGAKLDSAPSKVVVLSPSLAEIISDMGYASSLAGRSEECDSPSAVTALPKAGSVLVPDMDVISGLNPDMLLIQNEPSESVKKILKKKKIPYIVIPPAKTYDELITVYQTIGKIFSGSKSGLTKGKAQMTAIDSELESLSKEASQEAAKKAVKAVYVTDASGHVATGDTVLHKLITSAGAANAAGESTGWVADAAALSDVDVIFCPQALTEKVKSMTSFKNTQAVKNKRVYGIEAAAMERQSRRMTDAAHSMAKALFPDLFAGTTSTGTNN